jgi:hypothetical protein
MRSRLSLIYPSAWKVNSPNFADAEECYKRILSLPNVGWDMDSEEVPV